MYGLLVECKKRYYAKTTLTKLDICHEQLRALVLVYHRLGYFDYHKQKEMHDAATALRRFTTINYMINEIGAMIGGIMKSLKAEMAEKSADKAFKG